MKRRLSTEALRALLLNRLTKGLAFSDPAGYRARRDLLKVQLDAYTRAELLSTYPNHTYDVGP